MDGESVSGSLRRLSHLSEPQESPPWFKMPRRPNADPRRLGCFGRESRRSLGCFGKWFGKTGFGGSLMRLWEPCYCSCALVVLCSGATAIFRTIFWVSCISRWRSFRAGWGSWPTTPTESNSGFASMPIAVCRQPSIGARGTGCQSR